MRTFASALSLSLAVVAVVGRVATRIAAAWQARRVARQLCDLDDYMLRDMGITRLDLMAALAGPVLADPTEALAERAAENRMNLRAARRATLATLEDASAKASSSSPRRAA